MVKYISLNWYIERISFLFFFLSLIIIIRKSETIQFKCSKTNMQKCNSKKVFVEQYE